MPPKSYSPPYSLILPTSELRQAQEEWLEAEFVMIRQSGAKHVVVLSHVAPFMGAEEESQVGSSK